MTKEGKEGHSLDMFLNGRNIINIKSYIIDKGDSVMSIG